MATSRAMPDGTVAVLAKAPIPGFAKTRIIPLLGPHGAAALQQRLIERALATALAAEIGPVTLWCAPDDTYPFFRDAARRHGIRLAVQPDGDLGERMLTAFRSAPPGTALVLIGTDCPVLGPADLRDAAGPRPVRAHAVGDRVGCGPHPGESAEGGAARCRTQDDLGRGHTCGFRAP